MSEPITADILAFLNILVLERVRKDLFKITGTIPHWLDRFCDEELHPGKTVLVPNEKFPFVENFLIDAEEYWQNNSSKPLKSGYWSELDLSGEESHLEASALSLNERKILLIELADDIYQEKEKFIQKARENNLNYQRYHRDTQKKEILIHCLIHDIAGQLSGINCCLALLELEHLTPKGKERLDIGKKQTLRQEMLLRGILKAFSDEVENSDELNYSTDILKTIQDIIELLHPTFGLSKIELKLADDIDKQASWGVVAEKSRLERVIFNLLENALRYSPSGSTVKLNLKQDKEYITFMVEDQGIGVEPEVAKNLFQKFSQGQNVSGKSGLGLYFCRITVERWGGKIGFLPVPEGGARFWFKLPLAF
ncbi:MAG: HAMP domain-containing sensor histidine kinase [Cyanobacteria bacterium P01_A01_bin.45]